MSCIKHNLERNEPLEDDESKVIPHTGLIPKVIPLELFVISLISVSEIPGLEVANPSY